MRNFTAVKAGKGGTGDYAEYLLKEEALKKSSEYYVEGEKTATASMYIGSKSAKLGLHGEISVEAAKELLAGYTPDGTRIRGEKTSGEEILAHDNTLSAPKSVSIHCAEDMRLLDCHIAAVQQTIAALEKHYCVQRVQKNGIRTLEKGDGFVGWMTHHWTSRESEIDLHTHVITMNGCMGPDGTWRAVEDHQMSKALWIGSIYRNYLGQQVQGLGYKIREKKIEGKGYSFELEGYTDQDIEAFSTRHKQIAEAKKKGLSDREAWYTTRKGKEEELSLGELFEKTISKKAEIGCVGQSFPTSMNLRPIGKTDAKAIVNNAIAHLSRGSCRFSQADILAQAFDHIERVKLKDVEREIATHPELVDYGVIRRIDELKGQYTTAGALERETRIIKRWMRGQGQATPIMDNAASTEAIARLEAIYKMEWQQSHALRLQALRAKISDGDLSQRTAQKLQRLEKEAFQGLNKGQLGAVQGILATRNNNAIVYGLSGVGKTKSLRPTKDILDELGLDTVWLAPSLAAVEILTEDVGKQAYTLQRLAYTDSIQLKPGQLVFVDEFGLADAECMDLASAKAEAAGARMIGIGDHKQNQPIQAGSPMRSLMEHGAEVFKISEILRQQDPIQKRAVELIANGQGVDSIALLSEHGYVTEIQDPDERQDAIATQALGMTVEDFKNTLFITGTNAERLALTEKIRQGQKDAGILGKSLDCTQLEDSRLSPEQLTDLRNYAIGDYVAPVRDYAKAKRHEFCKVIGKTETHLILESPNGSSFELEPDVWDKKLYTAGTINVAVGDELRLRGNIYGKDFQNGQVFTVKEIEGAIATLEGKKGKTRTIDLSHPVPIDHNIVRTTHDVQGSGKEGAILSLTDDRTSNQGSTYVGISRQFEFLTIYTQNYDALLKRVSRECANENALDLLEFFDDGSRTRDSATPQTTHSPESGPTAAEQGNERGSQHDNGNSPFARASGDAGIHSPVQGGTGQSKTVRDGGVNQAPGQGDGSSGCETGQLGTNSRPGEFVSGDGSRRSQGLQESAAQQRARSTDDIQDLDNAATVNPSRYVGLDDLALRDRASAEDQSLFDRQIVEQLGHLIERLKQSSVQTVKPIYEDMAELFQGDGLETDIQMILESGLLERLESLNRTLAEPLASTQVPAYEGMDEHVQFTQLEQDERLLIENRVIERLEHLAQRLDDAQTNTPAQPYQGLGELIAMESHDTDVRHILESRIMNRLENVINQLESKTGAHHDLINSHSPSIRANENTQQNSSSDSSRTTARRDSGVEHDGRESRIERCATDISNSSGEPALIGSSGGIEGDDSEIARGYGGANQSLTPASRGQERNLPNHEAESGDCQGAARNSQGEYRDIEEEFGTTRKERNSTEPADSNYGREQTGTLASSLFNRATDGLPALADAIVRIRLRQELKEPLADLRSTVAELSKVNQLNERLKAELDAKRTTLAQQQAALQSEQKSIDATKVALLAKLEAQLAQTKVEILDTTLSEWRSLRQEPDLDGIPELAVAPSEVAELKSLIENYPAQKVVEYAMEEYAKTRDRVIDLASSINADAPMFKPEKSEHPAKTVDPPKLKVQRLDKPVKPDPFWMPDYSQAAPPDGFTEKHWAEATESAIDPRLVAANMRPASGDWVTQRLAETVLNDPRVSQASKDNLKAKYAPVVQGGIWFNAGYDIEALAAAKAGDRITETSWGVYKSFTPRIDEEKTKRKGELSFRKYENPIGQRREFFMPIVPPDMADEIYRKHGINPTAAERESGLYFVALTYNLPIVITEGAKKTMASLSQGHITIGMQGVNALYRARDDQGERLPERQFNESFACWATPGRKITFAFDADRKQSSIVAVRRALVHSVELLQQRGCEVKVAAWLPEEGKGLDDLIVQSGPGAYEKALAMAQPPDAAITAHYRYEYERVDSKLGGLATDEAIRAEMIVTNPQDADRVLAQSDTVKASLQWLDLILAKYGEEEEDEIVLGNWRFSKEGNSLIVKGRDGTVGLCVTGGSITNHTQWNEISRQIQSAVAAMTIHAPIKMSGAEK